MTELDRAQLKFDICKKNYHTQLNMFCINLLILIISLGILIGHPTNWYNAIALGGLLITLIYNYATLSAELYELKYYKSNLNRIEWTANDTIESLNNSVRFKNQFFTKDKKE